MARKSARKGAQKVARKVTRKAVRSWSEETLTKGQLRKLNALRKSVGEVIGTSAFARWLALQPAESGGIPDKNAEQIVAALEPLVQSKPILIIAEL